MTKTEIYKKNQKKSKRLQKLAPILFWVGLALAILCLVLSFRNSFGNVAEIIDLLDSSKYNDTEIAEHYHALVEKYGEWQIGSDSGGFAILFINIKSAVFGGFAILTAIFSAVFLAGAFLLGKWLVPYWAKQLQDENQDMVNLTILDNK